MNTNICYKSEQLLDEVMGKAAKWIYEATRIEAEWSKRSIVPEAWENRDDKFREQFIDIIKKYMAVENLPTPEEAHESWNQAYYRMGWKYGEKRDTVAKTHPDLVPFDKLPKDEQDKDAIFLAFVWLVRQINSQATQAIRDSVSGGKKAERCEPGAFEGYCQNHHIPVEKCWKLATPTTNGKGEKKS